MFSDVEVIHWRCEAGSFANKTSGRVVRQVGGARGIEANGVSVLHDLRVGAVGVASFGGAGGSSSGLSGGGDANGGT